MIGYLHATIIIRQSIKMWNQALLSIGPSKPSCMKFSVTRQSISFFYDADQLVAFLPTLNRKRNAG